jgi:hypothetical protein
MVSVFYLGSFRIFTRILQVHFILLQQYTLIFVT